MNGYLDKRQIFPNEGDSFIVKHNWIWQTPATYADAPAGYNWLYGDNLVDFSGTDMQGQGHTSTGYQSSNLNSVFDNHWVMIINGTLYDPSYGSTYANLAAWESACVVGAFVDWGSAGEEFARKRVAGDTFTKWNFLT